MRAAFVKAIHEIAVQNEKVVFLVGDVEPPGTELKKSFPYRYFNVGVCEQSIISMASGMALEGLFPVVYSITPFLIRRPFEQIFLDINCQNVKVLLVGYADYPHYGPSHNCQDAEQIMKLFPNIASYFPKTPEEVKAYTIAASENTGPSFISLRKYNV